MSPISVKSAFHHTLTAGMAVGATMAAAGILPSPAFAAASDVSVNPAETTEGASPEYALSWERVSGGGTAMTVRLEGFTTNADGACSSTAGTVSLDIRGTTATYACAYSGSTSTFTLSAVSPTTFRAGVVTVRFPAGMVIASTPGTSGFAVVDTLASVNATVNVEVAARPADPALPATPAAPPLDWMRQYQRSSQEEQCQPQWNPSYAMWANAGSGGWVCVQTDHWDTALGRWTLL